MLIDNIRYIIRAMHSEYNISCIIIIESDENVLSYFKFRTVTQNCYYNHCTMQLCVAGKLYKLLSKIIISLK